MIPAQPGPPTSLEEIMRGLRQAGIVSGDIVLVHSSLASLGFVPGGAETVIDALVQSVSPGGTVLFPTFTGSRELSRDNPPVFRPHETPCWTGLIPETARRRPDAVRSLGPTHSVCAIGTRAQWLTTGHEKCATPCGRESPFHKLQQVYGKVLFIGVDLSCCTLFHHVEELAGAPYVCVDEPVCARVILADGTEIPAPLRIHVYGFPRDYTRFEPELTARGILSFGKAGQAELRILQARPFCDLMVPRVREDPSVLLVGHTPPG
ncbi:MAG: AAC(3) family N-acetyltransferase [Armatimonadetes bacterium]|nr:AAC(3) family N-acetyltransferase [Armatimonadota bacterium]